jgi:hypothetical protein
VKAGELRAVLEHVPDDVDVVILSGHSCRHVHLVYREQAAGGRDGRLALFGRSPVWAACRDPHDFDLRGRFRRPDELSRRLDPDVPVEVTRG